MKSKILFLIISAFALFGCRNSSLNEKMPDIKSVSTSAGIAFDIRVIKDVYGPPPIVDLSKNTIGYYNIYCSYYGVFFWEVEPEESEIWYLLLEPTKDDNYYTGRRFRASFRAVGEKHKSFTHGAPLTEVDKIEKLPKIGLYNLPEDVKKPTKKNEQKPVQKSIR